MTWVEMGKLESRLLAGDEVLGTFRRSGGWGAPAAGETTEERWTFEKAGLLNPRIVAQPVGSKVQAATLSIGWRGSGTIELASRRWFRLTSRGFWRSEWVLIDSDRKRLLTIRPEFERGQTRASLEVDPAALSLRELPLLAMLCWYAVLLFSYDGGTGEGAIIATSSAGTS